MEMTSDAMWMMEYKWKYGTGEKCGRETGGGVWRREASGRKSGQEEMY